MLLITDSIPAMFRASNQTMNCNMLLYFFLLDTVCMQVSTGAILLIFSSEIASGSLSSKAAMTGNLYAVGACVTQGMYFSLIRYGATVSGCVSLPHSLPLASHP